MKTKMFLAAVIFFGTMNSSLAADCNQQFWTKPIDMSETKLMGCSDKMNFCDVVTQYKAAGENYDTQKTTCIFSRQKLLLLRKNPNATDGQAKLMLDRAFAPTYAVNGSYEACCPKTGSKSSSGTGPAPGRPVQTESTAGSLHE